MSEYAAPTGPPPPKVPEGWKAIWNAQYSEWFYVNIHTKASQWDKPTEPAVAPSDAPAADAPPSYQPGGNTPAVSDEKASNLYNNGAPGGDHQPGQEASRNEAASYYNSGNAAPSPGPGNLQQQPSYDQNQLPPRPAEQGGARGLFGKLMGKSNKPQQGYPQQQQGYPQQQQGYPQQPMGGYGPPQGQYGGYPQAGYGPPPGQYGQPPMGYGQPPMGYGQPPMGYGQPYGGYPPQGYGRGGGMMGGGGRRPGGGMGAGGAAALGVGGGLLGGMMLSNAINDGEQDAYQDGYQDGMDDGGMDDGGGDFGD